METINKDLPPNPFIEKVTQIIHENLSNEQFGVESLAEISGISRSQLFKNVKRATGKSVSKFIRDVKLEEAFKQLQERDLTVSQVAHNVGFSSHAYFATCFKDYFGYSPSEVKSREETLQDWTDLNSHSNNRIKRSWIITATLVVVTIVLGAFIMNTINKTKIDKEKTIAVIRFDNLTDDDGNQGFVDGLGEEIINSLCKIHDLKVTARNSSFQFSKDDDVAKISKSLGVNYVIEGSVRKENNMYRITTQLIDASDGYHVWSKTYDRKQKDILYLQEEIARLVAHELEIHLSQKEDDALREKVTSDSTAQRLYNEGVILANSGKISDLKKGIELVNKAIKSDSTFALAHARIVDLYRQYNFLGDLSWNETTEIMQEHVDKAFALDPSLGEAYIAKGYLEYRKSNYDEVLNSFSTATELLPNEPRAHFALAGILMHFNRTKERYAELEKAFELDPLNHRISLMAAQYFYFVKRDHRKGFEILENSISAFPDNDLAKCWIGVFTGSAPNGNLGETFKIFFNLHREKPKERMYLTFLVNATYWLELNEMRDVLINKLRLDYPNNIHTFWNTFHSNELNKKFIENEDLVNFWSRTQNLFLEDKIDYLSSTYINDEKFIEAKTLIEDSLFISKPSDFEFDNPEHFSDNSIRLDILEKFVIALRMLDEDKKATSYSEMAVKFIDKKISDLTSNEILDYRRELRLKIIRASVTNNIDKLINILENAYFEDRQKENTINELKTHPRYKPIEGHPEFIALKKRIEIDVSNMRSDVISYLKQEGYWEASWDD